MHKMKVNTPISFFPGFLGTTIINFDLIIVLAKREIQGRYKGSYFGFVWAIINPLLLLSVYTFIFSIVFKSRWTVGGSESRLDFALFMFVGVLLHGALAETLSGSTGVVLHNPNYVKKIVFPLEILPLVNVITALFHSLIGLVVLMTVLFCSTFSISWTCIFIPVVMIPLALYCLGISFVLASVGVFFRDISQWMGLIITALLFLSPVFYPVSALPEQYQVWMNLNPLTLIIEQMREIVIVGNMPDWLSLLKSTFFGITLCFFGYFLFQKTKKGFADVI